MANLKNRKAFRAGVLIATFAAACLLMGTSLLQAQTALNPYQQAVMDLDPVFYAPFDEEVQVLVGPAPTSTEESLDTEFGVVPGGASLRGGGMLSWSGEDVDSATFLRNGDTTYEFWFVAFEDNEFAAGTISPYSSSAFASDAGIQRSGGVTLRNTGPSFRSTYRDAAAQVNISQNVDASIDPPPEWGVWHHAAMVLTSQISPGNSTTLARATYYLDGEVVSQSDLLELDGFPSDTGTGTFSSFVTISAPFDPYYDSSPPRIDEFAIYDRALTQAQIQSHIALATPVNPPVSLPNPSFLGYDGIPYLGTSGSEFYPLCVVTIDTNDGWCFSDTFGRDGYIEDELLGTNAYGTIWIGRFDEEVVAP